MVLNIIVLALLHLTHSESINQCLYDLKQVVLGYNHIIDYHPPHYSKMLLYSGKGFNQLGVFESCFEMSEAKYVLVRFRKHPPIVWTVCGPESCSEDDWYYIVNSWINSTTGIIKSSDFNTLKSSSANVEKQKFSVHFPEHHIHNLFYEFNGPAIAMIVITVLIGTVCFVGTVLDFLIKQDEKEVKLDVEQTGVSNDDYLTLPDSDKPWANILICFSVVRNMKKLMSQHLDDYHPHLYFFDGIRVMTIGWVILGACGDYYFNKVPLVNYMKLEQVSKMYYSLPAYSALLAMDATLWIGGFLYAYFLLLSFPESPKSWISIYLKHYMEVVPLFIFVTFFFWTLARYMGFGPWFFTGNNLYNDCKDYWWANLFFISNLVPDGQWSECIGAGWYLSVEMQLFIFTPIIILIYRKIPILGWGICSGFIVLGVILGGVIAHHFDLNVSIAYRDTAWDFWNYYFTKPYIRMPPYLFGIISGFIYYASTNNSDDGIANLFVKLFKNKIYRLGNFIFGICLLLIVINVQFQVYEDPGSDMDYDKWSHKKTSAYFAFLRFCLGLSYTCIFTPMSLGYFPLLTPILSSQFWTPWSRLTLSAYLIHEPIIDICMRSLQSSKYFNKTYLFFEFLTMVPIVYFFAIFFTLIIDIPAKNLVIMLFHKRGESKERPGRQESNDRFAIND